MTVPGILAYRSILDGNKPYTVPDFRNKEERERYRGDNFTFDPTVAGSATAPSCSHPSPEIADAVYARIRAEYLDNLKT